MRIRLAALLLLTLIASIAGAHEVRPAFLEIREIEPGTYDVMWKTPAQGDMRLALNVVMPVECTDSGTARTSLVRGAVVQSWRTVCAGGLPGKQIVIEHLETSLTDAIVHFEPLDGSPKTLRMNGATPAMVIPQQQSATEVGGTYFRLGVAHILSGFDHLLFVLCLLMLIDNVKRLLGAITAFTLAHSITLAGTTFGWLRLASAPVEACIALSIAFVAAEILHSRRGRASTTQRWPWIASFCFGLLHGFGFAAALHEIGLPDDAVPLALLFFNLGVEAGQILFVCAVLVLVFLFRRYAPKPPAWAWRVPPYVAGTVASFWFIERTVRIVL